MTVIVKHNKTNSITDWTQAQLDEQIALGNFPSGTTLANIVLPSDWNNDHTLTGVGTMAEQDATAVAITGGTINNTTIGATTASTGRFTSVTTPSVTATTTDLTLSSISTGVVNVNTVNGTVAKFSDNTAGFSAVNYCYMLGRNAGAPPRYWVEGADANINTSISSKGTGSVSFFTNLGTAEQARVSHTASAVNYVQVTGAATGANPTLSVQGSDAIRGFGFNTKSTGAFLFYSNSGSNLQFRIDGSQAAVNYLQAQGSVATQAVIHSALGSDTNISMAFQPKGTGAIDLAAGSSGVNISNGGTVTAITRTAAGSNYTSVPSVAITAPTTAGGVTATATVSVGVNTVAVASGGTGYTVGNTLTIVGGTGTACVVTVSTVSSGVVTAVTYASGGSYTVTPSNPAATTGGSGTGCTINLTYGINNNGFTITNAGSGYIEQPTITFSGGGGSGAAAYATVGSTPIVKSLAGTSEIWTASGRQVIFGSAASTPTTNWTIYADSFGRSLIQASSTAGISSGGTNNFSIFTNSTAQEQLRVSHTASAVNYVQVTGAATGGSPTISAQGSDANVPIIVASKANGDARLQASGTGSAALMTDSGFSSIRAISRVASGDTFLDVQRAVGFVDLIASSGVTDGDIRLTPKGTGLVRFGTYVAGALLATGYINIKAADGTTYKVLVST